MADKDEIGTEGSSAKVLLVLGLLGGLAIGGGVSYFLFQDGSSNNTETEQSSSERKNEPKVPLQSVRFDRLTVPITSDVGGRSRFIGNFFINIDVRVRGNDNLIAVRRSEPQLKHAFISAISKNSLMREDAPQQLDMEKTAMVLKDKANSVLGDDVVADVNVIEAMRIPN